MKVESQPPKKLQLNKSLIRELTRSEATAYGGGIRPRFETDPYIGGCSGDCPNNFTCEACSAGSYCLCSGVPGCD